MLRIKKIISMVLMVVLILGVLPHVTLVAHAASYTIVTPTTTNGSYFSALPGVYEMGDGYAVIWATSFRGTGYIEYTYNGQKYTVYDERNGIVRTGDSIHVVKVPHEHLQGNSYTVYSREVKSHSWATTNYGVTASAGPITLKKYDGGVNTFDLLVLTDVHKQLDWAKKVAQQFKEPDLIVFSGDTVSSLNTKDDMVMLFNIMGTISHGAYGQVPMVYIRGNHECRGEYSTTLLEYLPTETGEYYFDFTYGPLYSVVLDTGEDKADQHWKTNYNCPRNEYGQLANFAEYHQRQEAWLRNLRKDDSATFRLGIYHIPRIHDLSRVDDTKQNLAQYTEHLGIQFGIAGHSHILGAYYDAANESATKLKHTVFQCGGGDSGDGATDATRTAVMITLNDITQKAYVTAKYSSGSTHATYNNYGIDFSTHITAPPEPIETERGLLNHFDKSNIYNAGTINLDTQPAVFETGGDWYNVIWKTSYTGTTSTEEYTPHGATGYVEYTYNGKTYQVFDEVGGSRHVCDDYHVVQIPKEHLNNNTYKVGSFLVLYDYIWKDTNTSRFYRAGNYVESPEYLFEDRSGDTAVNLISCPDIDMQASGASIANAKKAVDALGTSPAYIILNGNVNWIQYDSTAFTNLINAAATISGSSHPVILSRGHAECRGPVAPNLMKYLPTATGEYYYTVKVGDYTLVNVDTAEDDPDDVIENGSSKYGDRVHLDEKRLEQLAWINSLEEGNLIVISAMPLENMDSRLNLNYEEALKNKGAVLSIGGHADSFTLKETVDSDSIYTVVPGGNGSGMDVASVLVSGDYAYITECKYGSDGSTTYPTKKAVCLSDGSTKTIAASKPPRSGSVYTVSTPGHLKWIQENCTTTGTNGGHFDGYTFKLANDIDMMLVPFTPIGGCDTQNSDGQSASKAFGGIFDGNGYAIKNLNIQSTNNNVGLFGYLRQATVKNLTISGGMVTGGRYVGGLVGFCSASTVEDCYVDLVVYSPSGSKVGGVAGYTTGESTVTRCANYGHITGKASDSIFGGVVGQGMGSKTNYITYCYNRGPVTAHGASSACIAGGVVGYTGTAVYQVNNCYNAAPVNSLGICGTITSYTETNTKTAFSNNYYAVGYNGATISGCSNAGPMSQAEMKSEDFAKQLGSSVFTYVAHLNDGYPVHWNDIHYGSRSHGPYTSVVTTPATCTTAGVRINTCTCGMSYTESIAATNHNYSSEVTTAATCINTGVKTFTCVNCNHAYTEVIPATGHTEEAVPGKDASCTEPGLTEGVICSVCGATVTEQETIPATGHSYKSVVTAPTCTEKGYTTYTCSACNHSYTADEVAAKGHSYQTVVTAPTCTADGYTTYTCSCGDSYVADAVPALGHAYNTEVVEPTCTADGSVTSVCANCGDVTVEITPSAGHSYEGTVTLPSCTEDGFTSYVCAICGDSYVADVVAATGHSHEAVVTAPTCTEAGYTTYSCFCGDSFVADEVPAVGHTYESGVCTGCGGVDPDYIDPSIPYSLVGDMNGWDDQTHVMSGNGTVSVTVTLTEGTYLFKICRSHLEFGSADVITDSTADSGCLMSPTADSCTLIASGGTYCFTFDPATSLLVVTRLTNETEDAPLGNPKITLKSMTLSLENEVVYNLYFETEDIDVGAESMGLIIWDQEPTLPTINGGGTVIEGAVYLPNMDQYGISSMGIPAKNLGDLKYMVVYAKQSDGTYVYSRVLQYSARIYCLSRVQKSTDENMRALCVALMNYGAEAQKYFAATTDYTYTELMNEGFESYQYLVAAYSEDLLEMPGTVSVAKAGVFGTTANGFSSRSVSMSADGILALNYYFTTSQVADKVTFYYWTAERYNAVTELTAANASGSKEMTPSGSGNQYWTSFDGIAAKEMDHVIYACGIYEIDGKTYSTGVIAYSLAKYCANRAAAAGEFQTLAAATAVYGYHAKTYFGI